MPIHLNICKDVTEHVGSLEATLWTELGSDPSGHGHRTSEGIQRCLGPVSPLGCEVEPPWIRLVPARSMDAQSNWVQGNMEVRSTLRAVCCVLLVEQRLGQLHMSSCVHITARTAVQCERTTSETKLFWMDCWIILKAEVWHWDETSTVDMKGSFQPEIDFWFLHQQGL